MYMERDNCVNVCNNSTLQFHSYTITQDSMSPYRLHLLHGKRQPSNPYY